MNRFAQILPPTHVQLDVDVSSKKRAFEYAGLLFENSLGLNRALITDNLFARERLGSTGLGQGVAIPHGRIKGLKQPSAAVIRLRQPIAFEAPDAKHLELLSAIAEMLSDTDLREQLLSEADAAVLHHRISAWAPLQTAA
ncbi:PTS sugar transporter subunit IIA [Thiomonas sp. 13-64-67]|uniref:PTS sugar transporter subunit IIA n=1 Tax=Thiomonas sp. 13-64-67 TaxID=1970447 RepID=UPI000BD390D3|nr:PTS sugar transporter subunit IIA [Thiomonas sp. 13-64-67]OZB69010.1 MAG: PTS sugar transporter subunit IIA [Thiomonas sp. 13-64-67]